MTPAEHAAEAERLMDAADQLDGLKFDSPEYAIVTAIASLTHAVLALRPEPAPTPPPAPRLLLEEDGSVYTEVGGRLHVLDRHAGRWVRLHEDAVRPDRVVGWPGEPA